VKHHDILLDEIGFCIFDTDSVGETETGVVFVGAAVIGEVVMGEVVMGEVVMGEVVMGAVVFGEVVMGEVVTGEVVMGAVVLGAVVLGAVVLSGSYIKNRVTGLFNNVLSDPGEQPGAGTGTGILIGGGVGNCSRMGVFTALSSKRLALGSTTAPLDFMSKFPTD
jgi:hypothetical protein